MKNTFGKLAIVMCGLLSLCASRLSALQDRLEEMEKPWKAPLARMDLREYIGAVHGLTALHPETVSLSIRGRTPKGLPIYLLKCTDGTVPDDDKNVILVTTFHSGGERTATAGVMAFAEWLLSGAPLAQESLRKNILLVMPCNSPENHFLLEDYGNSGRIDTYSVGCGNRVDLTSDNLELLHPEWGPEVYAFYSVSDEFAPDIHVDVHGCPMHWSGQIQPATVGRAGSNSSLVSWDNEVDLVMQDACTRAGYGAIRFGVDSQRLIWGESIGRKWENYFDMGRPYYYTALYGYLKNHSLITTIESTWQESVVVPLQGLLAKANTGWSSGPVKDFRVNCIKNNGRNYLASYGATRAARRASRVELWRKQQYFAVGGSYCETNNWGLFTCTYGTEGLRTLIGSDGDNGRWGQISIDDFMKNIEKVDYIDMDAVKRFVSYKPEGVGKILFEKGDFGLDSAVPQLQSGVSLMIRLPTSECDLLHLCLNGKPLEPSDSDGYQSWDEGGFTCIRINVPKERVQAEPLLLVSLGWNSLFGRARNYGYLPGKQLQEWIDAEFAGSSGEEELLKAEEILRQYKADPGSYYIDK